MVVSRPVKDSCSLTPAGTLLVSSTDPGIKLHFLPDCTLENRTVTLQVSLQSIQTHPLRTCFCLWSEIHCPGLCRCFRCLQQRSRLCVETPRPRLALCSASLRVPAQISFSLSKFRSPCLLESQVECDLTPALSCLFEAAGMSQAFWFDSALIRSASCTFSSDLYCLIFVLVN